MTSPFLWTPGASNSGLLTAAFNLLADTSELASLANGSYVVSSVSGTSGVFNNSQTAQAPWSDTLALTLGAIGSALTGVPAIQGWFLKSYDGTHFEQAAVAPTYRTPDFIVINSVTVLGIR